MLTLAPGKLLIANNALSVANCLLPKIVIARLGNVYI